MKPTLLIMAAGLGSRFGGIKQLQAMGPNGEIIMDYSLHDAIKAGFGHIVFVIRRDIDKDFRRVIGDRAEKVCEKLGVRVSYAYQSIDGIPGTVPEGRVKPWGTCQAVLCAEEFLDGPFAVINADDYYGSAPFAPLADFLSGASGNELCMVGYRLGNTLSENGGVTRGVCEVEGGYLTRITETRNIVRGNGTAVSGDTLLPFDTPVSMNMWGLTPAYLKALKADFVGFLAGMTDPLKDEFILPVHIGALLSENSVRVKVIETEANWYGITFKQDIPAVSGAIGRLISEGTYRADLYSDLIGE